MSKNWTPERRREYFKKWRADKKAAGLCADCCKRPAGGPDGTRTMCGICAERHRRDSIVRHYRQHPTRREEVQERFTPVLVKRGPQTATKHHVTWLELSAGRSNT